MKLSNLVKHVSHSSLELARNDLALWVARYAHKIFEPANAAMARGNAVELGLYHMHNGSEFDSPVEEAMKEYNKRTALGVDAESREREREMIEPMMEQYRALWPETLPALSGYQNKIELEIEGLDVPCIGFTDFDLEDRVIDIKTTSRLPSAISASHRRQGAIYQRASANRAVEFIYLTPKKAARYVLEDSRQDWLEVVATAQRLQNFIAAFDNVEALTAAVIPNYDTFYWSSPQTREAGRRLYGF